ncbi:MAG TPA: class I SAM-dependent methyltransferase [Dehalococcoidia bacterium]|nr:class I SAM-dependent methyltransferase [Dehalococcoidia bacterium]
MKENLYPQSEAGSKVSGESPFDTLAGEYDAWFEDEGKITFAIEVEAFRRVLPLLPRPWLEVGVGSGRFAQALGIKIGIDPATKLLEIAKRRGINVFQAKGEERFFQTASFGTVFLIVTLCFVNSPVAVLREVHRILKAGGKIVLGLVLSDSPWGRFYLGKKKKGHPFYKHATFYSYTQIAELLDSTGFVIEKVVSTLFQKPHEVTEIEMPRDGLFPNAGFTIVVADKVSQAGRT